MPSDYAIGVPPPPVNARGESFMSRVAGLPPGGSFFQPHKTTVCAQVAASMLRKHGRISFYIRSVMTFKGNERGVMIWRVETPTRRKRKP
jgi:hypothetical protein